MSCFVIRRHTLFVIADDERFARDSHQHFIFRHFEIFMKSNVFPIKPSALEKPYMRPIASLHSTRQAEQYSCLT